jgi:hypothetical protein
VVSALLTVLALLGFLVWGWTPLGSVDDAWVLSRLRTGDGDYGPSPLKLPINSAADRGAELGGT